MGSRHRILVAAQPGAWPVLKNLLEELADLVPVHGMTEAMQVLEQDPAGIDLIICTLTFSDHRMLEFLLQVKGNPKTSAIPFWFAGRSLDACPKSWSCVWVRWPGTSKRISSTCRASRPTRPEKN